MCGRDSEIIRYPASIQLCDDRLLVLSSPEDSKCILKPRPTVSHYSIARTASMTSLSITRGMAEKGKIALLPEQTPAETFAALVHELAHSDMHFGERRTDTNKRIRETEPESVAFVVCSAIGLETGTAAQDYLGF